MYNPEPTIILGFEDEVQPTPLLVETGISASKWESMHPKARHGVVQQHQPQFATFLGAVSYDGSTDPAFLFDVPESS